MIVVVSVFEFFLNVYFMIREVYQERHDVSEFCIVGVVVVGQYGDPLKHVVSKADYFVVQENHVVFVDGAVVNDPEVLYVAVVILRAVLPGEYIYNALTSGIESIENLLSILSVASSK